MIKLKEWNLWDINFKGVLIINRYNIGDMLRITKLGENYGEEFIVDYIDECGGKIRYSNEVQFDGYVFEENDVELLFGSDSEFEPLEEITDTLKPFEDEDNCPYCEIEELKEQIEIQKDTLLALALDTVTSQRKLIEYLED